MKKAKHTFPVLSAKQLAERNTPFPPDEFSAVFAFAKAIHSPIGIRAIRLEW